LVAVKWERGKRKRYEKGRWVKEARERRNAGRPEGWKSRGMERRRVVRGRRRLGCRSSQTSRWLEKWI
jgi:hypothetical protein